MGGDVKQKMNNKRNVGIQMENKYNNRKDNTNKEHFNNTFLDDFQHSIKISLKSKETGSESYLFGCGAKQKPYIHIGLCA